MTQTSLFQQLREVCSSDRVDAYRVTGGSEIDALCLYVWNTALCESLYPSLQNLEIGLRNRLNDAMVKSHGDLEWYTDPAILIETSGRVKVEEAEQMLIDKGKTVTPARVISELSFGFWTGLFSVQYTDVIWERPGLLKDAFPNMPKTIRKRSTLAGRFGEVRKLRNRVFHHEPIRTRPSLNTEHANIIEALGWLDPCLQKVTTALDRFPEVHTEAYRDALKEKLIRACPVESKLLVAARRELATREETTISAQN